MKILIVGGSNSILKNGYAGQLAQALPGVTVLNRSVGAATSIMGYFRLVQGLDQGLGPDPGDVVVWEYALNDQGQIRNDRALTVDLALAYVERSLHRVLARGAHVVPLILRPRDFADSAVPSPYRQGLMALFAHYGVTPVDLAALYAEAHGGRDIPARAYSGTQHFAEDSGLPDLAARALAQRIRDLAVAPKPPGSLPPPLRGVPDDVAIITRFDGLESRPFRNSLVSETIWRGGAEDALIFTPAEGQWSLLSAVLLASPAEGAFALRTEQARAPFSVVHHHAIDKPLIRMRILPPDLRLKTSPGQGLSMVGTAAAGGARMKHALPQDTGLIGLVLERVIPPR